MAPPDRAGVGKTLASPSLSPWNPCSPWSVLWPCGSALQGAQPPRPLTAGVTGRGLAVCGSPCSPGGASSGEPHLRVLLSSPGGEPETLSSAWKL